MWHLYILLCDQKTFYVGITDNIKRRLTQHKRSESFFTKKFSEVELKYTKAFSKRSLAEKREKQIKRWSVAKKKALIVGDISLLKKLSSGHEVDKQFLVSANGEPAEPSDPAS